MIRTETDQETCRALWEQLSPGKEAWDDWDLMYAYHDPDRHRLNFLVHESVEGQADGLIPMVFDTTQSRYMLMGGSYPDGRILWIDYDQFPAFFEQLADRTVFFDLEQEWVNGLLQACPQYEANFAEQDLRYCLVPAEFDYDFNNHVERTFSSDKKMKFLYDLRHIRKREPVLRWSGDNEAERFIELVNRNFGAESDYNDEANANEIRRVIDELAKSDRLRTLVIEIEGRKEAVSLSVVHGNRMVAMYSSSNNDFNNLGKLLNFETIQEGCRLRVDEISFMTGMKWKADWKMKSEPCRTFRKPPGPWPETPA